MEDRELYQMIFRLRAPWIVSQVELNRLSKYPMDQWTEMM